MANWEDDEWTVGPVGDAKPRPARPDASAGIAGSAAGPATEKDEGEERAPAAQEEDPGSRREVAEGEGSGGPAPDAESPASAGEEDPGSGWEDEGATGRLEEAWRSHCASRSGACAPRPRPMAWPGAARLGDPLFGRCPARVPARSHAAGPVRVTVCGLSGELATVEADRQWTVADLKVAIEQAARVGLNEQELLAGTAALRDSQLLSALPEGDAVTVTLLRIQLLRLCVAGTSLRLLNVTGAALCLYAAVKHGRRPTLLKRQYLLAAGAEFIIHDWASVHPHCNVLVAHPQGGGADNSDRWHVALSEGRYDVTKFRDWKRS